MAKPAPGMCHSADDHALDVVNNQQMGQRDTDGSTPDERIERYGQVTGNGALAENIAYETYSARDILIGFIIDDGVPGRGHRLNIFNDVFTVIGVAVEHQPTSAVTCVITFAEGYTGRSQTGRTSAARKF